MNGIALNFLNLLSNELKGRKNMGASTCKLLDVGCGRGELLFFLYERLAMSFPEIDFQFSGLEIEGYGAGNEYLKQMNSASREKYGERGIHFSVIREADDEWPYEAHSFDFVISNQVLEHVADKEHFLARIKASLKPGGLNINSFPSAKSWMEPHLGLPRVHKTNDYFRVIARIKFWSRVFGRLFNEHKAHVPELSRDTYARYQADYLLFHTHYISAVEFLELNKRLGLKAYTSGNSDLLAYYLFKQFRDTSIIRVLSSLIPETVATATLERLASPFYVSSGLNSKRLGRLGP